MNSNHSLMLCSRALRHSRALLFALGAGTFAVNGFAATSTANMTVSADVTASCEITGAALAFGTYNPLSTTAATSSAGLSVTCTSGSSPVVKLGNGLNAVTNATTAALEARRMKGGTNTTTFMTYELYSDSARTTAWPTAGVSVTANGTPQTVTVYGQIPVKQNMPNDTYSDTVVATVEF